MPWRREGKRTASATSPVAASLSGGWPHREPWQGGGDGKQLPRQFILPSSNKENVPPVWAVRATPAKRRSTLPDWYPWTPLRDITAIVKETM